MSLNQDLLDGFRADLFLPETEETWDRIANGIDMLMEFCRSGACDAPHELISALKSVSHPLINALNSERTRLSGPAIELIATAASGLGSDFDPLLSIFFPPLLLLCSRSNKVVVGRAKACVITIVQSTQLPSILSHLSQHSKDKTPSLRLVVAEGTLACLNCFNPPDLEKESRARDIESLIRITATDAAANVRKVSRDIFKAYSVLLPGRVKSFIAPLSPTTKKYLEIKLSKDPDLPNDRRQLNFAASTSLVSAHPARCPESVVPERPKSSFSYRTNESKYIKKVKSNTQLSPPVQNNMAPLASQPRYVARRLPVSTAERLPATHVSSQLIRPLVSKSGCAAEEPRRREVSTGPKRMPMPETSSMGQISSQDDIQVLPSATNNVTAISEPPGFQKSLKLFKSDAKPIKQTSGDTTRNRSHNLASSQPSMQLRRAKTTVTSKPTVIRRPSRKRVSSKEIKVTMHENSVNLQVQRAMVGGTEGNQNLQRSGEETARPERETPKKKSIVEDKTPISALVSSIEQGFLFTPSSPPSPPQSYLNRGTVIIPRVPFPLRLRQKDIATESTQLSKTVTRDE